MPKLKKVAAKKSEGPRYLAVEMLDGWRVFKNFGNEQPLSSVYRTRDDAEARIAKLIQSDERRSAISNLRAEARSQCMCAGECGRGHTERCGNTDGATVVDLAATRVVLRPVAVNHNVDDLRRQNLRLYCQLCRQFHDAEARNTDPLVDIVEFAHG